MYYKERGLKKKKVTIRRELNEDSMFFFTFKKKKGSSIFMARNRCFHQIKSESFVGNQKAIISNMEAKHS